MRDRVRYERDAREALENRLLIAEARVEGLRDALQPFATAANLLDAAHHHPPLPDELALFPLTVNKGIYVRDVRRAKRAIEGSKK